MSAVWVLTTRGRPEACQEVLDACEKTGMSSRGLLYVDETVEDYENIRLPDNWEKHAEPKWGSISASLCYALERYPDATQYGWLADDTIPRSQRWDRKLEAAAGDWNLAYARDLWLSERLKTRRALERGGNLSAGLCWGAKLIQAVGWWALPGVTQAGIDTAWTALIHDRRRHRYLHDVVVEHRNYRTGKRDKDETDSWERPDVGNYIERDLKIRARWERGSAFRHARKRIPSGPA